MSAASQDLIQFVLSDMDGTLLMPDHSLSPAVIEAVAQLREAGVRFTLASSRPPRAMRQQIQTLGIDLPTAAFNGGVLVNPDGSELQSHWVERAAVDICLALFAQHRLDVWVFADDQWLARDRDAHYFPKELHALGYEPLIVDDFTPYLDRVHKMVATSSDFQLLIDLERQLQGPLSGKAIAARSQQYYLDITAVLANKGEALATLAAGLSIDLANTAVLGDGANDVAMFKRAGFSVAMGQGEQAVRDQADAVTASNAADGVAQAIHELILPRARR
ncbi:HAD family phosphatase [Pseudomonas sp. CFBP 8758]|uniref:HAD family phosphatase n=1 Tax=Pseudomonas baltica TaxID=2762576 RepID=A0A7X1G3R3_9PSED|nr:MULTISPECIES: Cof-type HAD-IIB family hydrolase [Pseudomonas]MBC2677139.1 HAD family phosphatase [Pseudomonas baltica]MBD8594561.1 HAD family phosphatase [Pseudomonas sp. CFBP 8758]